jgi:phospholipid/cholesterol/gamma-HCH transport system substrate-binding protein
MRRGQSPLQSIAASPTMVGAVTTLIVIVAVFLAYNANNGLPFVPTYRVSVVVPNAARMVKNNEVRIGGTRVGVVESIDITKVNPGEVANSANQAGTPVGTATQGSNTQSQTCCVAAELNLKLDKSASPIPEDSIFRVRYKSSFGLKYLEITRGTGKAAPEGYVFDGLDDSGTCRLPTDPSTFTSSIPDSAKNGCFQKQTEFDAINDTFNTKTRSNARKNLVGYGGAFAGRGASLNQAFAALQPLFLNLKPVSEVLADPNTELRRFFEAMGRTAQIVAPVATENAEFFGNASVAFAAIASDPEALRASISEGAALLTEGPSLLRRERPFLTEFTELSNRLNPGVRQLRVAIPTLNSAVRVGTNVLPKTPSMNHKLARVMVSLKKLVQQPATKTSIQRLQETFDTAKPLAQWVAPSQTVCNYWNYFWTMLPEHLTERDQIGFQQRIALVGGTVGPTESNFVQGPLNAYSGIQANGQTKPSGDPLQGIPGDTFAPHQIPILHGNSYAPTGQPNNVVRNYAGKLGLSGFSTNYNEYPDCQPGQTGYVLGNFPAPGQPPWSPAQVLANLPGSRGVTNVFYDQSGNRSLKNTTIPSHLPEPLP